MARSRNYTVLYRRKRKGRTDYNKRLRYLDSWKTRFVVRRSSICLTLQFIKYDSKGDHVLVGINSIVLKELGWRYSYNNIPAGYLSGFLIGKRALEKGIKEAVLDIGLYNSVKGGVLYAALKGAIDAGVIIPCSKDVLPGEDVVSGKRISGYAEKLLKNDLAYKKQFSGYLKRNLIPSDIIKNFEVVKGKIK